MATTEEIERRVEEADAARSARRAAAAKRVSELSELRAEAAEQLADIERELGDVLAESSDVIGVEELAKFTEVSASDLNQWLSNRKATRPKRRRATAQPAAKGDRSQPDSTAKAPPVSQKATPPAVTMPRTSADQSARTPEPVT